MRIKRKERLTCVCKRMGCWLGDEDGIPDYCQANEYLEEITKAQKEYAKPEVVETYRAACIAGAKNDGMRPRIEEALDFAKALGLSRIGFAACVAFGNELDVLVKLFTGEGFQVFCASCQIGRVSAEARDLPELSDYVNATCNPIAQAGILNRERTELNFIVGLCMGHDILFTRYSRAPVSTLIVKDRVTGNNPAAALYGWHARRALFGISRSEDKVV
jgi:uncharacterized metal-binding protein